MRSRFQKTKGLSPYELLVVLQLAIGDELPALYFDYFASHRKCWSLLRTVRKELHPQLCKLGSPNYIGGGHQLPFVIGLIFATAFRSERVAEAGGIRSVGSGKVRTGSRMLMTAGKVVEKFLAEEA
jgi:hypothetical protein